MTNSLHVLLFYCFTVLLFYCFTVYTACTYILYLEALRIYMKDTV